MLKFRLMAASMTFALVIVGFVALIGISKAAGEGAFDSCKFETEEQAITVARREFAYSVKNSKELQGHSFEVSVLHFGINAKGRYSARLLFRSIDSPKVARDMYISDDCTQAQTKVK